jgi:putative transposase
MTRVAPRAGAHSAHLLNLHLVFCVKYRRKELTAPMLARLEDGTRRMLPALACELVEFSGESDHVHFLIHHPPGLPVSEMAPRLKRSAYELRREAPRLRRVCRGPGYFAASVGAAPIGVLRRYIENQRPPDTIQRLPDSSPH